MTEALESCPHCGRGPLREEARALAQKRTEWVESWGEMTYLTYVETLICGTCSKPTVRQLTWIDEAEQATGERVLYPTERDDSALPQRVRARLAEARKLKTAPPSAYAVAVRRMLETVCNEQGATGG